MSLTVDLQFMNGTLYAIAKPGGEADGSWYSHGRLALRNTGEKRDSRPSFGWLIFAAQDDIATFHGKAARQRAFSSGWIGQTFLANYSVAARIQYTPPDLSQHLKDSTAKSALVAVHGGIHPDWANIESINTIGHKFLQRLTDAGATQLPRDTPPDERRFYSETGATQPYCYCGKSG